MGWGWGGGGGAVPANPCISVPFSHGRLDRRPLKSRPRLSPPAAPLPRDPRHPTPADDPNSGGPGRRSATRDAAGCGSKGSLKPMGGPWLEKTQDLRYFSHMGIDSPMDKTG